MDTLQEATELERPPLFSIFLVGVGTLMFEILLTRIFSVTMWYHFAFIAVSLALFGISASGVVLTFRPSLGVGEPLRKLGYSVLAFAIVVPIVFVSDLHIPFLPFDRGFGFRPYLFFFAKFIVLSLPFFFSGITIALSFQLFPKSINAVYFADLAGAGVGCAMVVPVLSAISGPSAIVLVSAFLFLSAALLFSRLEAQKKGTMCAIAAIATIVFVFANEQLHILRITKVKSYNPQMTQIVERPKIYERWHPVSRVAVHPVKGSGSPLAWFYSKQTPIGFPKLMEVTNDAGARTYIYPRMTLQEAQTIFRYDSSDIAYRLLKNPDVLVIGIGGGKDILGALAFGCASVTGVELNPLMIDLQTVFEDFSGNPYKDPRVRIVIDEGRNFAASGKEHYDLIKLSGTDTWAASAVGAYSLVENYLYTREAVIDFMESLKPGGFVSITRWYPQEALRLATLTSETLRSIGFSDSEERIAMVRNEGLGGEATVNFLIKNGTFSEEEVRVLQDATAEAGHTLVYAPGLREFHDTHSLEPTLRSALTENWRTVSEKTGLNLAPPTDDRPFFFSFVSFKDASEKKYLSKGGFTMQHGRAMNLLLGMFFVSSLVVLLFLIAPFLLTRKKLLGTVNRAARFGITLYFLAVGFGYLLVEIPLMQRLILFLGHPVYALTVVLFSLLFFSGLGSIAAQRIPLHSHRVYFLLIVSSFMVTLLMGFFLPAFLKAITGWSVYGRIVLAILVVAPIGFLLGIPFPTGMSIVSRVDPTAVSWAWAVNGAASVTAPVVAMICAMQWGFTRTLYIGGSFYALATILYLITLKNTLSATDAVAYEGSSTTIHAAQ